MSAPPLRYAVDGPVAWITLDRPERGNAIDDAMADALLEAARRCAADAAIRCAVLTGRGRMFCAGGDVAAFAAAGDGRAAIVRSLAERLHDALAILGGMAKPLVTLVNGTAAGGGLGLALAGDIVIAAQSAHFTAAYTAIGVTPDGGLTWRLPRLVGLRRAQEMILTNRRIDAEEAERIGLVTRTVADDELEAEGRRTATALAGGATGALSRCRELLLAGERNDPETQMRLEAAAIAAASATPDAAEGIAAFVKRRRPRFERT